MLVQQPQEHAAEPETPQVEDPRERKREAVRRSRQRAREARGDRKAEETIRGEIIVRFYHVRKTGTPARVHVSTVRKTLHFTSAVFTCGEVLERMRRSYLPGLDVSVPVDKGGMSDCVFLRNASWEGSYLQAKGEFPPSFEPHYVLHNRAPSELSIYFLDNQEATHATGDLDA